MSVQASDLISYTLPLLLHIMYETSLWFIYVLFSYGNILSIKSAREVRKNMKIVTLILFW